MESLLVAAVVIVVGLYLTHRRSEQAQKYMHQAWLHAIHVQDDCWRRANDRARIDAYTIKRLEESNNAMIQQVSELTGMRLNFAVMQDQILENVRRTIRREMKSEDEVHEEVNSYGDSGSETTRITRDEFQMVGSGGNGKG